MEHSYNCIVVDDEKNAAALLSNSIKSLFTEIEVAGVYSSWQTALTALRSQSFDLVFMDVSMPGKNGMDLLRLIPDLDAEVIFVTAHEEYALKAFEFTPAGYLLKPVDDIELSDVINRALKRVMHKRAAAQSKIPAAPGTLLIGISGLKGVDYVDVNDILYLESQQKCTKVVTTAKTYISTNNLGKFKDLTERYSFFQVHRTFIVNLNKIVRFESLGYIIMQDGSKIPVARNSKLDFLKASNVISKHLFGSQSED